MQIANPIYDTVFKYLMNDLGCAKLLLSTLMREEITDLQFASQEFAVLDPSKAKTMKFSGSIFRLDFSAKIKTSKGQETVTLIEIQKSKIHTTSKRFRTYRGKQLLNQEFYYDVTKGKKTYKAGIPIYTIYFLGEPLSEELAQIPIIKVDIDIKDNHNGQSIDIIDPFIESLYIRGIIVNIPALKGEVRDDVENLLQIFNQKKMIDKGHIITMDDSTISAKFQPIVRRLQKAAMDKEMLQQMELEDEFIAEMDMYYDDLENAVRMKEDALRMKEEERRMKEDALRMKEDALKLKGEAIKKQHKAVQLMVESGIDKLFISENLGLTVEEIEEMVETRK